MATIQSAVIKPDTIIDTRIDSTHDGKKYAHVWIGNITGSADSSINLLSNASAELRRLAANITAVADKLDEVTS